MRWLLDTCSFIWLVGDSPSLSVAAREIIGDAESKLYLSAISIWEIVLKYQSGKMLLPEAPELFIPRQCELRSIEILPLMTSIIYALRKIPDIHSDPFDRMLVCQAQAEKMTILTPDRHIRLYPVATAW